MKKLFKTVLAPMREYGYDTRFCIEMKDMYNYFITTGVSRFALLDAYSLEYLGEVTLG